MIFVSLAVTTFAVFIPAWLPGWKSLLLYGSAPVALLVHLWRVDTTSWGTGLHHMAHLWGIFLLGIIVVPVVSRALSLAMAHPKATGMDTPVPPSVIWGLRYGVPSCLAAGLALLTAYALVGRVMLAG